MKNAYKRLFSLLLVLTLAASLLPAVRADEGEEAGETPNSVSSITRSLNEGSLLFSGLKAEIQARCRTELGQTLDYVTGISVLPEQGTLYDGYSSEADTGAGVAGLQRYYLGSGGTGVYLLDDVRFVPKPGFYGLATISYTGFYTDSADGRSKAYSGAILVTVAQSAAGVSYSTEGEAVRFSSFDLSEYCLAVTGRTIRYVTFSLPDSRCGALYCNYIDDDIYESAVTSSTRYFRNESPRIDDVCFVPKSGYSGVVSLTFSGIDTGGASVSGRIDIAVNDYGSGASEASEEEFVYRVDPRRSVSLRVSEFSALSLRETGYPLSYIQFTSLPASSRGRLCYGSSNTAVATNLTYSTSELSDVRFIAGESFEGVVIVPFTGYATGSNSANRRWFDGTIRFIVSDTGNAPLHYTVDPGRRVYFERDDFADAGYSAMGYPLSRIRFTSLPDASLGTLYYYNGDTNARVTTQTGSGSNTGYTYYYTSGLSNISFFAAGDFEGTVTIPFVGYAGTYAGSTEPTFSGSVVITSSSYRSASDGASSPQISYYTTGLPVTFRAADFTSAASGALSGSAVTVRLTAPDKEQGRLYVDFVSPTNRTAFNAWQEYPVSVLSRISFLPKARYSGAVTLPYTLIDESGNSYTSSLRIRVTPASYSLYFNDMSGYGFAAQSVDFLYSYKIVNGTARRMFSPRSAMTRGDFVLMLSRAFSLPAAGKESFADVPSGKAYTAAVASAKAAGIVTADKDGNFHPKSAITRQDAALYLYRCMLRAGTVTAGSAADLASFSDRGAVSQEAAAAMGAMARDGIFLGDGAGHLLPNSTLSRAQMAAILHRALTS